MTVEAPTKPDHVDGKDHLDPNDGLALREAFSRVPAAVTVVTSFGPDGPCGMTASAVCPLSVDPPLLLVCVANGSGTLRHLRGHGRFAVNTLRVEDSGLAKRFAGPPGPRFAGVAHRVVDAAPILAAALGYFTCSVAQTHPGGDHTIIVGRIRSVALGSGWPLLWHARDYRRLAPTLLPVLSETQSVLSETQSVLSDNQSILSEPRPAWRT